MAFDQDRFDRDLTTQTLGRPLHWFAEVDSTNTMLWELLAQGAKPGTTVIAAQQQAGRGQWGRTWQSALGGLYLSVAIAPHISADCTPQLTLCSAWGIAQQLRQQGLPIDLKWPNDLLLNGRKLGGILTETTIQSGRVSQAVIGIGMNWQNPVPDTALSLQAYVAQSRRSAPVIDSLEHLAATVLNGLEQGIHYWQQVGLETFLPDYLQLVTAWRTTEPTIQLSNTFTLSLHQYP